ncbi:hypothetical protein [Borrelia crocidurae]|uniref:Uncharacterized protein n=1 Tax=Borrelia crocidurae (strain Achema) TaxID=1155096 RepID=I0FC45_BORCA|nr:hypothetical protein [Borrelia crocidurae]AFI31051.1 hypothetical protein Q7M_272 [Borrelia crocidurae str. Achema]
MLFGKKSKYILLFSSFAFILAMILGIFARVSFVTVLFRAFLQFLIFFAIGLLIEFIYNKYLYELFKDNDLSSNKDVINKNDNSQPELNDIDSSLIKDFSSKNDKVDNSNYDFSEDLNKYANVRDRQNNVNFESKLSEQISYVKNSDPKVVADTIKTLINKKE